MKSSMGKKVLPSLVFGFILIHSLQCLAYEMPNRIDVFVSPKIEYNSSSGQFSYFYSLTSMATSIQDVRFFSVLTDRFYPHANSPRGWEDYKSTPIGLPPMVYWAAGWGDLPEGKMVPDHGGIDPSPFNIKPGSTLDGFSFESKEPPGVATFYSGGFVKVPDVIEEPIEGEPHPPREFGVDAFQGKTVGPVVVTDNSLGGLINRLISLKDSMPSFGWVTNQGIITSLNVKLSAANESIAKGHNKAAVNQLNAFINELDAQKGKQVNENAWALLKANAEFLISKLVE